MPIRVRLNLAMARAGINGNDLAARIGITPQNLSILRAGRARAVRFSTLAALCRELGCQPGDLLEYVADGDDDAAGSDDQADGGTRK
ncbi:MAG: helix-turn-helix domain-containing protein [Planctomycetota bacterium]